MRTWKKIISGVLSAAMLFSFCTVGASAAAPAAQAAETDLTNVDNWVTDRTEPSGFTINNGKISFGVTESPAAENWYAYQGRKAYTGVEASNGWSVEYTLDITSEMLTTDNINTSVWVQVDKVGSNTVESQTDCVDWGIVQYINKTTGGPKWQAWDAANGGWNDVVDITPTEGSHTVKTSFDDGVIHHYIDGTLARTYTITEDESTVTNTAPAAVIVQGRSYKCSGKAASNR